MAETPSTMTLAAGTPAPDFTLPDPSGIPHALADLKGAKATVVAFVCNHCPYVIHLADAVAKFAEEYATQGVGFVAISSNNVEKYPQDSPALMKAFAAESGWAFPYLYDESQAVAKAYFAACTPDFYVFDASLKLAYCGQFDGSRPKNDAPITGESLRAAVDAVVGGEPVPEPQIPSTGCNIKWKPGEEPTYFGVA